MFANMLFLAPIVLALLGIGVLIWTRRGEIFSKSCSSCRGWGYWYSHAILGPKTKETCTTCNGAGKIRRLALFKSVIANVGSMMKHTAYFLMFLLSSIIGIFFMYLGSTGSWDATTIIMSMMGVMGVIGVYHYIKVYIHPWCRQTVIEAKDNNLICTDPGGIEAEIKSLEDALELAGSEDEMEAIGARLDRLEKLRDNPTDPFATRRK